MRNRESKAAVNRLLAEQVRANTLSAAHYTGLRRLPGKKKPTGNFGKIILGVCILVSSFVVYQGLVS